MEVNEIATKKDLEAMERRIAAMIAKINTEPKGLMNVQQACKYLGGMAEQTLRQKCCNGEIASHKAGGLRFTKADLDEYVDKTRRRTLDELARINKM